MFARNIMQLSQLTTDALITRGEVKKEKRERKKDAGGFSARRWKRNINRAVKRGVCMYMPLT